MTPSDCGPDARAPADGSDSAQSGAASDLERSATVLASVLPLLRRLRSDAGRDKPP